eukprot:404605-Rhodomonas_salina.4
MSGTDMLYVASFGTERPDVAVRCPVLKHPALPSFDTDRAYGVQHPLWRTSLLPLLHVPSPILLATSYAMSGTDISSIPDQPSTSLYDVRYWNALFHVPSPLFSYQVPM